MPSRSDEIFGHDFTRGHLSCFGGFLDIADEFLFLLLEFCAFAVEFSLGFFEGALVLAETFGGGEAFAECPAKWRG